MHLHFVCSGNSYRSRLAEAYCKSINQSEDLRITSSGIIATKTRLGNGPICWYTMRLMRRHNLIPFMSWSETQTTKAILRTVDYLVCMREDHYSACLHLGYDPKKPYEIWDIPDLNEMPGFIPSTTPGLKTDLNHIKLTEQTYKQITTKADHILKRLVA